jgi:DnaD/phage-associated family protein
MDKPYFPFYPGDWLSDPNVQFLSLEEAGAYITLLAYMWRDGKDCALPDDNKYLARLLHISTRKWAKLREILIDGEHAVFEKTSDGLIRNKRLSEEWEKAVKKSESRAAAAKAKWEKQKTGDANAEQTESKSNASASGLQMQNDAISKSFSKSYPDLDQEREKEIMRARAEIVRAYEQTCGPLRGEPGLLDGLLDYVEQGMDKQLVIHAIRRSSQADNPARYADKILANWRRQGLLTIEALRERQVNQTNGGNSHGGNRQRAPADREQDAQWERIESSFFA